MYQDYQNDQFQNEEIGQNQNGHSSNERRSYEQAMNNYVSKQSILPKILSKQKSVKQHQKIKQTNQKKKVFTSLQSQDFDSVPKKSMSQYAVFKKKSGQNRYQSLDVNKSKTIQIQQKEFLIRSKKKKSSLIQSIKLKKQVSIKRNDINLLTSNQINRKLTLNATNQTEVQKIQHYFNHSKADLQKINQDELNRINNRLHQWIEKLNRRLDVLLQKWVSQEGRKKSSCQNNAEKIVEILERHIQNNNNLLLRIDQENKKLQDKSGQMKEQEYQFLLYKQIDRVKEKIKQEAKNIITLKKKNELSGTKIVKQQDSKVYQQKINEYKTQVIKFRKQEDNNKTILQQLEKKHLKVKQHFQRSDELLRSLLKQAEQKQIVLNECKLDLKWTQLKAKVQRMKASNHSNLTSTQKNVNKISQQNKLLKNQIKQYDQDIDDLNNKINLITEKLNLEKPEFMPKSKTNNTNSMLFSFKNKKEPQKMIASTNLTLKTKESENKIRDYQQKQSLIYLSKIQESEVNSQLKSHKDIVKQANESKNQKEQQKIIQNSVNQVDKVEQYEVNEFMDLKLDKINEKYSFQNRQNNSISPNNKIESKINENNSDSLAVSQQKRKKSNRRFFIKKRNNEDQR